MKFNFQAFSAIYLHEMEVISLTDLIIQKIFRMKSILKNDGKTEVSEGIDANFQDILNYAVFAQILLKE